VGLDGAAGDRPAKRPRCDRRDLHGGYGALLLGAQRHLCAIGGHSPALWSSGADSAAGAFDDAEDYSRHDIVNHPPHYSAPVWIDVGTEDPFHSAAVHYAHEIHAQLHVWPGGHDSGYWHSHMRQYLAFYAGTAPDPKIELHVHLEGTVRPDTLRAIANRNDYALPDDLESLYQFRDFAHFIESLDPHDERAPHRRGLPPGRDDYAAEAASHGAVYLEAIFSPAERLGAGSAGTRSSAATATARRRRASCTESRCG
jgi:hypothetical protein